MNISSVHDRVGTVVQVVSKVITTQGSQSIAGNAVNVLIGAGTDFELAITPKFNGSLFKIEHRWFGETDYNENLPRNITRDGVNVNGSGTTGYSALTMATKSYGEGPDNLTTAEIVQVTILDKGGSNVGVAITYRMVVSSSRASSMTLWTNRCFVAPGGTAEQGSSEIIITEIAQ